jgi:hypothetical protein
LYWQILRNGVREQSFSVMKMELTSIQEIIRTTDNKQIKGDKI